MRLGNDLRLSDVQLTVLRSAQTTLDAARASVGRLGPHRSLLRLQFTASNLMEVLLVAALPCVLLVMAKAQLMGFWQAVIGWWALRLEMPLSLASGTGHQAAWLLWNGDAQWPTSTVIVVTCILVLSIFARTFWMPDRQLPLKYLVRIVCTVQASAVVFFLLMPRQFPYSISSHLMSMLDAGYFLMIAIPILLALGWGVLRLPLHQKLLYPVLIMLYFAVMLPHKALLHALILQHFSLLFMPVLYLCFGVVFDLMMFVALYSWLASRAPESALSESDV